MYSLPRKPVKLSSEMCRICLRSSTTSSVNVSVVAEQYREITDFVIQPTDVPQRLCLECHNLIQEFYEFVQTCKKTEDTLRALQEEIKSEPEPEPTETYYVEDPEVKEEMISDMEWSSESDDDEKINEETQTPSKQSSSKIISTEVSSKCLECNECGKTFSYKSDIRVHIETHLPVENRSTATVCEICGKFFRSIRAIEIHQMRKHALDMNPFKVTCKICGILVPRLSAAAHRTTHDSITEINLYRCDFCPDKVFRYKQGVKRHLRTQHFSNNFQPVIKKSFSCFFCGEVFTSEQKKRSHELVVHKVSKTVEQKPECEKVCELKRPIQKRKQHGTTRCSRVSEDSTEEEESDEDEVIAATYDEDQIRFNRMPESSKSTYFWSYDRFKRWLASKNFEDTLNEEIVLEYFKELAEHKKPTSLMVEYSKLQLLLRLDNKVDLREFKSLRAVLKEKSRGFQSTPKKTLTRAQIENFISNAPNEVFLLSKVVTLFGVFGAMRTPELAKLKISHIKETPTYLYVTTPKTQKSKPKKFLISGEKYLELYNQYKVLRPADASHNRFFINYLPLKQKCTKAPIGTNKIAQVPKDLARYLKLDGADLYTWYSARQSIASFVNFEVSGNQLQGDECAQLDVLALEVASKSQNQENEESINKCKNLTNADKEKLNASDRVKPNKLDRERQIAKFNMLTDTEKKTHENVYERFLEWQASHGWQNNFSEEVLLEYFKQRSKDFKPSSLWTLLSRLTWLCCIKLNINLKNFHNLKHFIKEQCKGYQPISYKSLTVKQIDEFIDRAPNEAYLCVKLFAIFGMFGAMGVEEFLNLEISAIKETPTFLHVSSPKVNRREKTTPKYFLISGKKYIDIYHQYKALRPDNMPNNRFFLHIINRKCTRSPIGVNSFQKMPKEIASFLNLDHPELYNIQGFRKSSAVAFVNFNFSDQAQVQTSINASEIGTNENAQDNDKFDENLDENQARFKSLPEETLVSYEHAYERFMAWAASYNPTDMFSEDTLLEFFKEKSKILKPPSLFANFSKLLYLLRVKRNVDIENFKRVKAFLSTNSKGYKSIKWKRLSKMDIDRFIVNAPSDEYLLIKVVAIFCAFGAMSKKEILNLHLSHIKETPTYLHVTTPKTNSKKTQSSNFKITGKRYLDIYYQYKAMRPFNITHNRFFIQYLPQKRTCSKSPVGINKIRTISKQIATFLKLRNPELYKIHCMRKITSDVVNSQSDSSE